MLEITNPFDFLIEIRSNDIAECSPFVESRIPGCMIHPNQTQTFSSDGMRGVISINVYNADTDIPYNSLDSRYHEDGGLVGEVNFRVSPNDGESYKWEAGFDNPVYDSKGNNVLDQGGSDGGNNNGGDGGGNGELIFWRSREQAAFFSNCGPGADVKVFNSKDFGTKKTTQFYNDGQVNCNTTSGVARFSLPPGEYYYSLVRTECTGGIGPYGPITISAGECKVIMLEK